MTDRARLIAEMKRSGNTYAQIGDFLGVSRQRVQQILRPSREESLEIFRRANGRCEGCHRIYKPLHLHHSDYCGGPIVALCTSCHRMADSGVSLSNLSLSSENVEMISRKRGRVICVNIRTKNLEITDRQAEAEGLSRSTWIDRLIQNTIRGKEETTK